MLKGKLKEKLKSIGKCVLYGMVSVIFFKVPVFASDIPGVSQTISLGQAVMGGLTGLVAVLAGVKGVQKALEWQAAGDEEKPAKKKALVNVVVIGVVGTLIGSIITYVLGFYGG